MTPPLKRRGLELPLSAGPGTGVFAGYASMFNVADQSGDIVLPGAFHISLIRRPAEDIRMLFQHDPAEPIGTWLEVRETPRGLYVLGRLNKSVQRGRELLALLECGGIDGLSIGFKTIRAGKNKTGSNRLISQIDLWEISLVTFPMLESARVSAVKARAEAAFGLAQ
jgi:HK97 family phage prohead protease